MPLLLSSAPLYWHELKLIDSESNSNQSSFRKGSFGKKSDDPKVPGSRWLIKSCGGGIGGIEAIMWNVRFTCRSPAPPCHFPPPHAPKHKLQALMSSFFMLFLYYYKLSWNRNDHYFLKIALHSHFKHADHKIITNFLVSPRQNLSV